MRRSIVADPRCTTESPSALRGHILIVVENVPLSMDHRVSKQVTTLLERGHRVTVITRRHPGNRRFHGMGGLRLLEYAGPSEPSGLVGYVFEYAYSLFMATVMALRCRLRGPIDVVQICAPPDINALVGSVLRAFGARVIIDQRDLLPELYRARYGGSRRALVRLLVWLEGVSQRTADRVICVNEHLRDRAILRSRVPAGRVTIVRNGPVARSVALASSDAELKAGSRFLCCWVGVMGRQDRLDLLLGSIRHLVHDLGRTDCRFLVIGDGEARAEAIALSKDFGLDPWVVFTGWLAENDVFRHLASADIGIDASLQPEVSPVKAMEYMAFGLPFAAFDVGETRRMSEVAASLATPGDVEDLARTIDLLLRDAPARRDMARVGKAKIADDLGWDVQEIRYQAVLEELMGSRVGRRSPRFA
jgi:glycosyltransferase involved in cell wall biosynthesis